MGMANSRPFLLIEPPAMILSSMISSATGKLSGQLQRMSDFSLNGESQNLSTKRTELRQASKRSSRPTRSQNRTRAFAGWSAILRRKKSLKKRTFLRGGEEFYLLFPFTDAHGTLRPS
jgi:hypothetical protein